ncbi:MAG: hypothetical protein U0792_13670 [Gemmataceae bacterium]
MVTRRTRRAQKKVEEWHFESRKSLLEEDEVMTISGSGFTVPGKTFSTARTWRYELRGDRLRSSKITEQLRPRLRPRRARRVRGQSPRDAV